MFYNLELIMAGVILLSTMVAGGIVMWRKRRKENLENSQLNSNNDPDCLP